MIEALCRVHNLLEIVGTDIWSPSIQRAWDEGAAEMAALLRTGPAEEWPVEGNPYEQDTPEHRAWHCAWVMAEWRAWLPLHCYQHDLPPRVAAHATRQAGIWDYPVTQTPEGAPIIILPPNWEREVPL